MRAFIRHIIFASAIPLSAATAQQSTRLSRAEAIAAAADRGPRLALARADTALAGALVASAQAFPNPILSAIYTRDIPRYHVTAEVPLDFLAVRGTRVKSAEASRLAAQYRFAFNRALLALEADTTYTRSLAAQAHTVLSRRNAEAADSLRQMTVARQVAGDASELDVELATINAGQQANLAAADSITLVSSLLDLQSVIGMASDRVAIELSDTLAPHEAFITSPMGASGLDSTLPVVEAAAALRAADLALRLERRSIFGMPGLVFGFDAGDPTRDTNGLLPTVGIALPLPIFNRNKGPIAVARAEHDRASAELAIAQVESRAAIIRATRELRGANARLGRDTLLVASADRVASMSLSAYREGAAPLASVLEAQRNAREVLGQYIDDMASALVAAATLHALTRPPSSGSQP